MRYSNVRTPYGPRFYRSRQEAKWACFLTEIGVRFHYEQCKVDLGGGVRYIPDFHLLDLGAWLEIKSGNFGPVQLDKVRRLAEITRERGFLFGDPDITAAGQGFVLGPEGEIQGGSLFKWSICPDCQRPDVVRLTRPAEFACGCVVRAAGDNKRVTEAFERATVLFDTTTTRKKIEIPGTVQSSSSSLRRATMGRG